MVGYVCIAAYGMSTGPGEFLGTVSWVSRIVVYEGRPALCSRTTATGDLSKIAAPYQDRYARNARPLRAVYARQKLGNLLGPVVNPPVRLVTPVMGTKNGLI